MAGGFGVQVTGLRETVRSLEQFGAEVSDLKAAFRTIGQLVVRAADDRAPKLTGRLAGSIKASNTKNKSIVRAGGAAIPYAGVIHYGGYHNIKPNPFLTTAAADKRPAVITTLESELAKVANRLGL